MYNDDDIKKLDEEWKSPDWENIIRPYKAEDVIRLRGSLRLDHTLAKLGAQKLRKMLKDEHYIQALGTQTGTQAVEQVSAGIKAIYVSGWQIAADANDAYETYPDQSLYPLLSAPHLIRRINNAFLRADQICHMQNKKEIDFFVPIVADAEAGFGGPLNTFELIKAMIKEGVSAIHLEDQLSSLKKCGHMGGKVLVPANIFLQKLITARFAADIMDVPTLIIARCDAQSAQLIRSDSDPMDKKYLTGKRSKEGYFYINGGIPMCIERGLTYAPYADIIWCETSTPSLKDAEEFAKAIHDQYPGKWLAYNCSPSFNWKKHLNDKELFSFQKNLADMGYKFQFITLAGFHTLNASMFELALNYKQKGMLAYADFQENEFKLEKEYGYGAIKHQQFVGAGYFDEVINTITLGEASTKALEGSTEEEQF